MASSSKSTGLHFQRKEKNSGVIATSIGLCSLRFSDPIVVIPMLALAAIAFVIICVHHQGRIFTRIMWACLFVAALVYIGTKNLTDKATPVSHRVEAIRQKATDSKCSNVVAGNNANVNCQDQEVNGKNEKSKH